MEKLELIDSPAANAINKVEELRTKEPKKDYPIIRCQKCHEIFDLSFHLKSKSVLLICEKDNIKEKIEYDNFFDNIDKYDEINCCQLYQEKRISEKYYICKSCSNKILCENCFKNHNKEDEIIQFKIDSSCKKHLNPLESYCPTCKENKCRYCILEHDSSHEKKEIFLRNKIIKKTF